MSYDDPIPVMMKLIESYQSIPQLLSIWKDCVFIVKLRRVCETGVDTNPLAHTRVQLPYPNESDHPIPTTGAFILTLIGKWDDIHKYNYSALKYTITHLHNNNTDDQAKFDALQEMGRHINACFTHPIAQQMIITANGQLSVAGQLNIILGLVVSVDDRTTMNGGHSARIMYPFDTIPSFMTDCWQGSSDCWLCLLFRDSINQYVYYLPIADLSQHRLSLVTRLPQYLPPAEAAAYNALIDKWQHEKCKKELSLCIPRPNELNPYTYLEVWNSVIRQQQHEEEEKYRQFDQLIKSKAIEKFEEYDIQIMVLKEQLETLQAQITTLQDEMIALKEEHEHEIITLKEECHRKEIEAEDILIAMCNQDTTLTSNNNDIPPHILNQISFLQQQLQSANTTYQEQLETKEAIHQQQIAELTQSKDKQIAELMQMLADANRK